MCGKIKMIFAALTVLALGACVQPGPSVVQSTAPTVTYKFDGTQQQFLETSRQADSYCAGYSGNAGLEETYRNGSDHYAVYSCK
jgi:hypothetical protein